jgi:mono/diheme cytochrome c family protein
MNRVKSMIPKSGGRFSEKIMLKQPAKAKYHCIAALAGAVIAASACAVASVVAIAQDAPHGDVATGKRIYLAVGCFTCHGRSGQGGALNGPAPILASTAMPFDGFKGQIRDPSNDMPAYSDAVLSDKDIADIFAFVKSLPGPRSPKDISILNN